MRVRCIRPSLSRSMNELRALAEATSNAVNKSTAVARGRAIDPGASAIPAAVVNTTITVIRGLARSVTSRRLIRPAAVETPTPSTTEPPAPSAKPAAKEAAKEATTLEHGGPVLTAGTMPESPAAASKKRGFLSAFFGTSQATAAPSPAAVPGSPTTGSTRWDRPTGSG